MIEGISNFLMKISSIFENQNNHIKVKVDIESYNINFKFVR